MHALFWAIVLLTVFAVSRWGGRTLSHHYGDGEEIGAALAVALGAVAPLALIDYTGASTGVVVPLVAVALGAGLGTGYGRRV